MKSGWLCALALVAVCAPVAQTTDAAEKSSLAGTWNLQMPRPGMEPAVVNGRLVLTIAGAKWSGVVTFVRVLNGRTCDLADLAVKGGSAEFRVESMGQDLRFEARLEKDALSGRCLWKGCGDFRFTATRAEDGSLERFEKDLKFDGYLPRADAEKLGMSGAALDEMLRTASTNDTDAVIVLRDGHVVAERYFGHPQTAIHTMSVTKFVVAFAVAMLLEDRKIPSLDTPISTWLPDWNAGRKAKVTLRHLVTHTSGIAHEKLAANLNGARDKVAYVRARDVTVEPGTEWSYNNDAVALLSGVLATAAQRPVDEYLRERLFAPLALRSVAWDRDAAGNPITYAQLCLSARDLARIGQLVVDEGKAGSKQVLAAASFASLAAPATSVKDDQGVLWMLLRDEATKEVQGVYHTGSLGQWIVVLPKSRTVAVRLRREKPGAYEAGAEREFGGFASMIAACAR